MFACLCGGILELAFLGLASVLSVGGTYWYNLTHFKRCRKQCECKCHDGDGEDGLSNTTIKE